MVRTQFVPFTPEQSQQIAVTTTRPYRIQAGDILKIEFSYLDQLTQTGVLVLPDGTVSLTGIDRVQLAGLTVTQADSLLTQCYARDYQSPELTVMVLESKGNQVYVVGEVTHPGLYSIPQTSIGVLGAIAAAGGFTEDASRSSTVLVRTTRDGYLCCNVDLSDPGKVSASPGAMVVLEPYDIVYVSRSRIADIGYFSRNVLTGVLNMAQVFAQGRYVITGTYYR
jgi:polysaccharide export outer membrane protein